MRRFILRRLFYIVLVMVAISLFVFALSRQVGDPRMLYVSPYTRLDQESWDAMGRAMGLDKPFMVQYGIWLSNAVRGDFGESIHHHVNSLDLIRGDFRPTAELAGVAFLVAIVTGIPLGVASAVWRGSVLDYMVRGFALAGQAVPVFWLGVID